MDHSGSGSVALQRTCPEQTVRRSDLKQSLQQWIHVAQPTAITNMCVKIRIAIIVLYAAAISVEKLRYIDGIFDGRAKEGDQLLLGDHLKERWPSWILTAEVAHKHLPN